MIDATPQPHQHHRHSPSSNTKQQSGAAAVDKILARYRPHWVTSTGRSVGGGEYGPRQRQTTTTTTMNGPTDKLLG